MTNTFAYRNVEWIDLESPSYEEVKDVADRHKFNRVLAEELLRPTPKARVDLYHDYLYLVLHFPAIKHSHTASTSQEIDFIIGKNFIVTTHYDTIDPLHEFSKIFEVNSITDRGDMGEHAGFVFYHMLKHVYKGMEDELESIKDRLTRTQAGIFSGRENRMVEEISRLSRDVLDIKGILRPHEHILEQLSIAALNFFGKDFEYPMHAIKSDYYRLWTEVLNAADMVVELRETNNTLLSTRQNEIMRQFAAVAFIALPVGLGLTLLQIDTVSRPLVGTPGDFYAILLGSVALAILLYSYSKAKKWL